MSSSVDQKVVELQFNNKAFEQNIQTTLQSLDALKEKLDLGDNVGHSFDQLQRAANKLSMDKATSAIQGIADKIDYLTSATGKFIETIEDKLVSMAISFAKSVTIDPVISGYQEYNTQMDTTQTIFSNVKNSGKTLEDVTNALDELNTYADKTIYNFTQMTHSIGMFTTAGVGLETSVKSIKGLSNLAALSGADANAANRAMYNMSQAMSSGSVRLQDWMSIENAGMAGASFQEMLIKSAKLHDVNYDGLKKKYGSFRNTLSTGWLTADIMNDVLENLQLVTSDSTEKELEAARELLRNKGYSEEDVEYWIDMAATAGDAATKVKTFSQLIDTLGEALGSGWATTWRTIIGDFEEAKELFTSWSNELGSVVDASSDARNRILSAWKTFGGRDALIGGITNLYNTAKDIFGTLGKGVSSLIFGGTSNAAQLDSRGKDLADYSKKLEEATKALREWVNGTNELTGNSRLEDVQKIGRGIASAVNIISLGLQHVGKWIGDIFSKVGLGSAAGNIVDTYLKTWSETADWVWNLYLKLVRAKDLSEFIGIFREELTAQWTKLQESFSRFLHGTETEKGALTKLKEWFLGEDTDGDGEIGVEGVLKKNLQKWAKDLLYKAKVWLFGVSADQMKEGASIEGVITRLKHWFLGEDKNGDGYVDSDGAIQKLQKWGKKIWYKSQAWLFGVAKYGGDGKGGAIGALKRWWLGEDADGDGQVDTKGFLQRVKDWTSKLWGQVQEYFVGGQFWSDIKSIPGKISKAFDYILEAVGLPTGSFSSFLDQVKEWFGNLWETISDWFGGINLSDFNIGDVITSIGDFFKGIWEAIKGLFSGGGETIGEDDANKVSDTLTAVSTIADRVCGSEGFSLKGLASDAIKSVIDFVSDIVNYLLDKFPFDRLVKLAASFVSLKSVWSIGTGVKKLGEGINEIGQGFKATAFRRAGLDCEETKNGLQKFAESMKDIGKALLMIAGSVLIVAIAAKIFDGVSWEGMGKMGLALLAIVGAVYVIGKLTGKTRQAKKQLAAVGIAMAGIGAALLMTALAVAVLGAIPFDNLLQGGVAAVILLIVLAGITTALSKWGGNDTDGKSIMKAGITAVLLAAAITLLTIPIFLLGSMPTPVLVQGMVAVSLLGILLGGVIIAISLLGKGISTKAIVSIVVMTVCITALAAVVMILAMLPTNKLILAGVVIVALTGCIVGLGFALAAFGPLAGPILLGAAAIAGAIAILAGGMSIAIGIISAGLASAGNNLLKAGNTFEHVADAFGNVDESGLQKGVDLVEIMGDIFEKFKGVDTSGYDKVSTKMNGLSAKLSIANVLLGTITTDGNNAKTLAENIASIYSSLASVTSLDNYEMLATSIAQMGAALFLFAGEISGGEISNVAVKNSGRIGEMLSTIASGMADNDAQNKIAELTWLADDGQGTDLTSLGLGLVTLAGGLAEYSKKAAGIDYDKMVLANDALDQLVILVNKIEPTNDSNWFFDLIGYQQEDKISQFSTAITTLGGALSAYCTSVKDCDTDKAAAAVGVADQIVELQKKLTDSTRWTSGVWGWFTTNDSIDTFGQKIETMGTYLSGFAGKFNNSGIVSDNVEYAIQIVERFGKVQEQINKLDVGQSSTGLRIGDLTWDLRELPSRIKEFYNGMKEAGWDDEGNVVSVSDTFATLMENLGNNFYSFVDTVDAATKSIGTINVTAYNSGVDIAQGLIDGLGESASNVYKTAYGLGLSAIAGINAGADVNSPSKKAFRSGMFIDQGLANGLAQYSGLVMDAGEQVSKDTLDQAQSLVDQFSSTISANLNDQPVIRPVLDLTELQNGSATIGSMFSGNYGINPGFIPTPTYLNGDRRNGYISDESREGSSLGTAVQQLSEKVNQLGDRIMSMQLVLDSGELVGGIAEQMDNELGARTARKVRGN